MLSCKDGVLRVINRGGVRKSSNPVATESSVALGASEQLPVEANRIEGNDAVEGSV